MWINMLWWSGRGFVRETVGLELGGIKTEPVSGDEVLFFLRLLAPDPKT